MQPSGARHLLAELGGADGVLIEIATAENLVAPELKSLLAYWLGKCAGRFAPARSDIDPMDFPALLPRIHMHEVLDSGRAFKVRVLGTQITAAIGSDQTGRVVTAADKDAMAERTYSAMVAAVKARRPLRINAKRSVAPEVTFMSAETLWLPLSDDGASVNKLLACSIFTECELLF